MNCCTRMRSFVTAHVDRELLEFEYCTSQLQNARVMLKVVQKVMDGMMVCDGAWCKDNLEILRVAMEHARENVNITLPAKLLKEEAVDTIMDEYEERGYISVTRTYGSRDVDE